MPSTEILSLTPMQAKVLMHQAWNKSEFVHPWTIVSNVYEHEDNDGLPKDSAASLRVIRALAEKGMVKHYPEATLAGGSDNDYLITEQGIQWRVDHAVSMYKVHLAQHVWDENEREEALTKVKVVLEHFNKRYSTRGRLEIHSNSEPMSDKEYRELRDMGYSAYDLEEDQAEEMPMGYVTREQALAVAAAFGVTLS